MSRWAMSFASMFGRKAYPSHDIFATGHGLQVQGVGAESITTEMI